MGGDLVRPGWDIVVGGGDEREHCNGKIRGMGTRNIVMAGVDTVLGGRDAITGGILQEGTFEVDGE